MISFASQQTEATMLEDEVESTEAVANRPLPERPRQTSQPETSQQLTLIKDALELNPDKLRRTDKTLGAVRDLL